MLMLDTLNYLKSLGVAFDPATVVGNVPTVPWIYANWLPAEVTVPDQIIVISDYMSMPPTLTMNGTGAPALEHPRMQVMVRDSPREVVACYNRIRDIYVKLCMVIDTVLGATRYSFIPIDSPTIMGRDDAQRIKYVCNFQVTMQ